MPSEDADKIIRRLGRIPSSRCQANRCLGGSGTRVLFDLGRIAQSGGARRDRTDDLLLAKQALSQLSYGPVQMAGTRGQAWMRRPEVENASKLVGPIRGPDLVLAISEVSDPLSWWAWKDLNFRPHAYQARALTN